MKSVSSRHLFIAGLALVLVTNAIVLGGVWYNRSATPGSLITLSERELELPYRLHEENSGLSLHLNWRTLGREDHSGAYSGWGSPAWFTKEKLKELGFKDEQLQEGQEDEDDTWRSPLPRSAFIVLELDGKTYQEAIKRAERELAQEKGKKGADEQEITWARERLAEERLARSRLFAIDGGLDPKQLRRTYPDRSRFLIAPGQIRPSMQYNDTKREIYGMISDLSVEDIHVPLSQRQMFMNLINKDKIQADSNGAPRYHVVVAYGKRFEPWIASVSAF